MELIIWGILCAVLFIAEAMTCQLVGIWFGIGSLAAFFVALFGGGLTAQLIVFIVVSAVLLILTRPFLKKMMAGNTAATNADLDIGERATVLEEINGERGTGRARRNGVDWIAVSETGEIIPEGATVIIRQIQGAKLIVAPDSAYTAQKQTI